jgi:enoyl-CoA hydratase/carnithine racemase
MTDKAPRVDVQRDNAIARITLCNATHRNAVTRAMWAALTQTALELAEDTTLRAVLIRGEGEVAFASGADISEFGENRRSADETDAYHAEVQAALDAIEALPVPSVAQVHGFCVGAGTAIALACDLRYLDDQTRFGIPAAKLGIGYHPDWIRRLTDVVGTVTAAEILLTARLYDANKALRCGFANEVLPASELGTFVDAQLAAIERNAPLSMAAAKTTLRQIAAFDSNRDWEAAHNAAHLCATSLDYQTALTAFAEKRAPEFEGK